MNPKNGEPKMDENKVALAIFLVICFCLIVAEVVLLLYIGAKDRRITYGPIEIDSLFFWNDYGVTFTVKNAGIAGLTIVEVRVNGEYATMEPYHVELYPGDQATITVIITGGFISGVVYEFTFITNRGNVFPYTATAP